LSRKFKIALAQCESVVGTADFDPRPVNVARLDKAVRAAAAQGAELVLFGEMFLTGYRTDKSNPLWAVELADSDTTLRAVRDIAAREGVHIMFGTATHSATAALGVHNTAVLINAGGLVGSYHKLHVAKIVVPSGEDVDEAAYCSAGSEAPVWQTKFGVIGPQICYDSSFPELSRTQSLKGAEMLLNITASATGFEAMWAHMRAVRAFENSAYYVACSVVGVQNGDRFFGRSAVVNPFGETLVEAVDGAEDLVFAEIDPDETVRWRARMNTMPARRPDAYGDEISLPNRPTHPNQPSHQSTQES